MQMIARVAAIALMLGLSSTSAFAQILSARGTAASPYSGRLTPAVRSAVTQQAKLNALERYIAETNPAKQRLFDSVRDKLAASLDTYLLGATVISETDDAKAKTYSMTIKVDINQARFENALSDSSGSSPARPNGAQVVAVFVARTPGSIQQFDDRVYKREDAGVAISKKADVQAQSREGERVGRGGVSTSDSASVSKNYSANVSTTSETGGSTTRKADAVTWTVASANDVDQQMTGIFANAGMQIVSADFVERLDLAAVRRDFGTGNDLSSATLRSVVAAVKAAGAPILVLGWIDEQMPDTDPVTGSARQSVKLNARVYDLSQNLPRVISSIGPIQYAGIGASRDAASVNAINLAAQEAAKKLVDEISVKGVR